MPQPTPRADKTLFTGSAAILLHLGFAATGVGTVLLGAILPRLSVEWHLRDSDAGSLLLVQFAASALGALLVRRHLQRTMAIGYGLFAAGGLAIFFLQQRSLPAFSVFGLGLGMAMTSTNVLVGRRWAHRRGAALAILNFAWSAGAVACPLLAAGLLQTAQASTLFGLVGLLVIPFVFLTALTGRNALTVEAADVPAGKQEAWTIAYFAALAFLYVGTESAVGNWMSTYAIRDTYTSFAGSSLVIALFWGSLLAGRAITPAGLLLLTEQRLYQLASVTAIAGICLLLLSHRRFALVAGSAITGLSLGPLFPLNLSLFLSEIGESRNFGWVFAVAGLGGAVCSWLTGVISSAAGSLRVALTVPAFTATIMAAMANLRRRP